MVNYILRRLALMLPTLLGITFVVFMMLALSPGGIGAALLASGGGGAMQSSNDIAIQRAKLEDRYGLNESAVTQYFRWLGRISPVKFGQRDLVKPSGELVSAPRPIPEPAAWTWAQASLPPVNTALREQTRTKFQALDPSARAEAFKALEAAYVSARADFTAKDATSRDALARLVDVLEGARASAEATGDTATAAQLAPWRRDRLLAHAGKPNVDRIAALPAPRDLAQAAPVIQQIAQTTEAWGRAAEAREALLGGMQTSPYPAAGVAIIPGVLSLAFPDLGIAFSTQQPVIDLIGRALPVTLLLNLLAFPIIYLVAIPSGMLAAVRRGGIADVGLGGVFIGLYSIPVVLAGVLALGFLATPEYFDWFPASGLHDKAAETFTFFPSTGPGGVWQRGYLLDLLWHLMLPVLCIVYGSFAVISKQTRAAMLENLSADYVRTAKAKGVAPVDVIFRHVLRNSLLPLITMFVTIFPAMLAGSVVIERIFSIPGMGSLLLDAIAQRDRELLLANTTMIAIVNLLALLLADILYALADPRITYK